MINYILFCILLGSSSFIALGQNEASSVFNNDEGINGQVLAIALQSDGKIVIGGKFSAVNGITRQNIARLNVDGSLDRTFAEQFANGVNGTVLALAVTQTGGVLVGGNFSTAGNKTRMNLACYKSDGSLDTSFGAAEGGEVANGPVQALAVQPDGKIILGGNFTVVYGKPHRSLARLNADSTLDLTLNSQDLIDGVVSAVVSSPSVIAGGNFPATEKFPRSILKVDN